MLRNRTGSLPPGPAGRSRSGDEPLIYTVGRDYQQRLALPVRNLSGQRLAVRCQVGPLDGGLIGDFEGEGTADHSLVLAPQGGGQAMLTLFAQDATRAAVHSHVIIYDANSGAWLAVAPITIFIKQPTQNLLVSVGPPEPGSLARKVSVANRGDALTDLAVSLGPTLQGRAFVSPSIDHAFLAAGRLMDFRVYPKLDSAFSRLAGQIVISDAGHQQTAPLEFELPAGQHVFVAHGFCVSDYRAAGQYCTNNPNTDTPIGSPAPAPGPVPCPLVQPDCFGLPKGNTRISQPGAWRVYGEPGGTHTVPFDYRPTPPHFV